MASRVEVNLIRTANPDWMDLAADWYPSDLTPGDIENWITRIAREARPGDDELEDG